MTNQTVNDHQSSGVKVPEIPQPKGSVEDPRIPVKLFSGTFDPANFVVEGKVLPTLNGTPEVLIWGDRIFVRRHHDQSYVNYIETYATLLAETV